MVSGGMIPMRRGVRASRRMRAAPLTAPASIAAAGTPAVIHAPAAYHSGSGAPVHAHAYDAYAVSAAVRQYGTHAASAALDNSFFFWYTVFSIFFLPFCPSGCIPDGFIFFGPALPHAACAFLL